MTWKRGRKEGMNTVVGRIREVTAVPDERARMKLDGTREIAVYNES